MIATITKKRQDTKNPNKFFFYYYPIVISNLNLNLQAIFEIKLENQFLLFFIIENENFTILKFVRKENKIKK